MDDLPIWGMVGEVTTTDMEDGGDPLEDRPLGVSSLSSTMKREKSLISLQ